MRVDCLRISAYIELSLASLQKHVLPSRLTANIALQTSLRGGTDMPNVYGQV